MHGGKAGAAGNVHLSDGGRPHPKSHYRLQPGQRVILELPGGGGFGEPSERDIKRILADVRAGYVSIEAAARDYGVVIDAESMQIDEGATAAMRG